MTHAKTSAELAKVMGITRQGAEARAKKPGFPPKTAKGWDLAAVQAWQALQPPEPEQMAAARAAKGGKGAAPVKVDADAVNEAKARKIIADGVKAEHEARIAERKLARLNGESVDRSEVDELLHHIASEQKLLLYKFRSDLLPKLTQLDASEWPAEVASWEDAICEAMQRIVDDWKPGQSGDDA